MNRSESAALLPIPAGTPSEAESRPLSLSRLIREASRSLALLDADRLEELAVACHHLNLAMQRNDPAGRSALTAEASGAAVHMRAFAQVLTATRGNLNVIRQLQELRRGEVEYTIPLTGRR